MAGPDPGGDRLSLERTRTTGAVLLGLRRHPRGKPGVELFTRGGTAVATLRFTSQLRVGAYCTYLSIDRAREERIARGAERSRTLVTTPQYR